MPRKLKTFVTNLGFYELAIAAPSMKTALEAWGMHGNAFKNGFASETDDSKIVTATIAKPGTVLRRPVGSKGAFTENAELPTLSDVLSKDSLPPKPAKRRAKAAKLRQAAKKTKGADKAAVISFEKAKVERDRKNRAEEARQEAQRRKNDSRTKRAVAKAQTVLDAAKERHETALADIEKGRDSLDRRAKVEKERWEKEREKLEEAVERATR